MEKPSVFTCFVYATSDKPSKNRTMGDYNLQKQWVRVFCVVVVLLGCGLIIGDFAKGDPTIGPEANASQLGEVDSTAATPLHTQTGYQPQNLTVITVSGNR